jgi:hypothetical protein
MTGKVLRDRSALPALDSLMERTMDVQQSRLAATLCAGFRARGRRPERLRALIGLALDFWTWHGLNRENLDDGAAAELMADLIAAAAQPAP